MTTPRSRRRTSACKAAGASTFSIAQQRPPNGRSTRWSSLAAGVICGSASAAWPSLPLVTCWMISLAKSGFCKTTACILRPNAASSAAIYSRSTWRLDASAPASAGRIRSGSCKPLSTACEPFARPSPSSFNCRRISSRDCFSAIVRSRRMVSVSISPNERRCACNSPSAVRTAAKSASTAACSSSCSRRAFSSASAASSRALVALAISEASSLTRASVLSRRSSGARDLVG